MRIVIVALVATTALAGCRRNRTRPAPIPAVDAAVVQTVPVRRKLEIRFDVAPRTLPPDDVRIRAVFEEPGGSKLTIGGFASAGAFAVRFAPRVVGPHRYEIHADGGAGERLVRTGSFTATPGGGHGYVRLDAKDPHRLVFDDGTPFFVLGENRINVYDPSWNYGNLGIEAYVAQMAQFGMTTLRFFVFTDCEREDPPGAPQLGCLEPRIGQFDDAVATELDRIFDAAEKHDVYVVVAPWAIGFTGGAETWRSWADNPYSKARGGPLEKADDFFSSPKYAEKKLRYVLARWGWSPHLLSIDLLNEPEWDGPIPETTWIPWAEQVAQIARDEDPWKHLITAGPVGLKWNVGEGDEKPWYASPRNDLVQWHLYGKEYYDPLALATEMTRRVEETWGFNKPVFCGEFAYGGEDKTTYDHTHVGIWSAAMSGAGALAHSAPQFQIDSDEPMTPDRARHFLALSKFLRSLSPGLSPKRDVGVTPPGARVWSLRSESGDHRGLWVLGPPIGYGKPIAGAQISIPDLPKGRYRVDWWDDVSNAPLGSGDVESTGGATRINVPSFVRHVAGRVSRAE